MGDCFATAVATHVGLALGFSIYAARKRLDDGSLMLFALVGPFIYRQFWARHIKRSHLVSG